MLEAAPVSERSQVTKYHETLNDTKRRLILSAIEEAEGNITRAAVLLGLNANYLHRLINNLDLRTLIEG